MSISNGDGGIIVNGLNYNTVPYYKRSETELAQGEFYVADGAGGFLGAMAAIITSEDIAAYYIVELVLTETATYNISGTCAPPGSTVYLSKGFQKGSLDTLTENVIAQTESDAEGKFSFSGVTGITGSVSAWIRVPYADADLTGFDEPYDFISTGSINAAAVAMSVESTEDSTESESTTDPETNLILMTATFPGGVKEIACATCGGTGLQESGDPCNGGCGGDGVSNIIRYTVTGTCPLDVTTVNLSIRECEGCKGTGFYNGVVCSSCEGDGTAVDLDNPTAVALKNSRHTSTTPTDGYYTITSPGNRDYGYDWTYIVWAESETGGVLTIDSVVPSDGYSICLSGDTMIAMADGSQRRLDGLSEGDMVLAEGGKPTRVYALSRGHFAEYHTLYRFEDGTVIDETGPHRFYNADQGFWQLLSRWKIGDHAVDRSGLKTALVAVERVEEQAERFGVWTEDGSYYANGLLSGATSCNKRLLADATAEQAVDMMMTAGETQLLKLIGLEGIMP